MAIDKNADFTPSIPDSGVVPTKLPYNPTGSFKFWAQKVLPLVYDDSLSYYEVLCKVVNYLNNVIQNVDNLNDSVNSTNQSFETLKGYVNTTKDTLINTYNELQDYVNTYFDNLDVQEEINAKLDAMAESGELTNLLAPFIPDLVTQWLNNHVTPTSPVIDNTLTISGAGADAKVTGDKITELKNNLGELRYTKTAVSRFIDIPVSVSVGDILYFKPIEWSGDSVTHFTMSGIKSGEFTTLATLPTLNSEIYYIATSEQDSIRVTANTDSAPTTTQTFTVLFANLSNQNNVVDIALKNKNDITNLIPLLTPTYNMKGYFTGTNLANANSAGCWLIVSSYVDGLVDSPNGLSGDYLLKVNKFDNGYSQELISLIRADERHIRYILNSTGTGTWYSYRYTIAFNSKGFITGTTLTDKNTIGSWLLVSDYVAGLTDAPNGLSGDYLLNVFPFPNGYAQELISLIRPDERHIRYVLNSTGTGTWHSIRRDNIKIATFGDSITRGQVGGTNPVQYTDSGFVRAATAKGYEVTNYGVGGIGYSYTVNSHNALYEISNANLTNVDIVTLSFGVNDWQNNIPVGTINDNTIDTLCGGINLAITKIIEKAPTAEIIVFSPLNCTFEGGSADSKWALGLSLPTSGTLEGVFEAIKAVCDKYEIAFVDLTHGNPAVTCLNANNTNVLGDGLHPTVNTYKHLGRIIANYI